MFFFGQQAAALSLSFGNDMGQFMTNAQLEYKIGLNSNAL